MAVTTATCPRCGAQLQPTAGSDRATCGYCGTVAFIGPHRPVNVAQAPAQSNLPLVPMLVGCAGLVVLGVAGAVFALARSPSPTVSAPLALPAAAPRVANGEASSASARSAAPPIEVSEGFPPLIADVNGDGVADVVVVLSTTGAKSAEHYAVFDGKSGAAIARTPVIEDPNQAVSAVIERRLLTASHTGQLTSYGLATGSEQWTTALGARVSAFCAAKNADSVLIATDEQQQLTIDLTTGRQTPTKDRCTSVLVRAKGNDDPRDRRDYHAPLGVESYQCGGVTVMGDQNYSVADQCLARAHVDTDHLDGMVGHRLWRLGQNWLVFGVRKPGAYVPMVGLIARGRLAWKAQVPEDNPLEAQEGSPQFVGLAGSLLIAGYRTGKASRWFVTAFAVADGARRWTVPLAERARISALATSADRVFVQGNGTLFILDAGDGKNIATLGGKT